MVSNTNDIAKWLNLQVGAIQNNTISKQTIEQSHIPDQSVEPIPQDAYYASGGSLRKRMTNDTYGTMGQIQRFHLILSCNLMNK